MSRSMVPCICTHQRSDQDVRHFHHLKRVPQCSSWSIPLPRNSYSGTHHPQLVVPLLEHHNMYSSVSGFCSAPCFLFVCCCFGHTVWHADLSSPTRDQSWGPSSESMGSSSLHRQGIPCTMFLNSPMSCVSVVCFL